EASSQNCIRKGVTYRTSRYSAFSADSHRPTPSAVPTASNSRNGNNNTCAPGRIPYQTTITTSATNAIAKSTRPESTLESGKISRGKYTRVMIRWFSTTTFVAEDSAVAK